MLRSNSQAHWRSREASKRRKFLSVLSSAEDVFKESERDGRIAEVRAFFVDFWVSTPHPWAQLVLVVGWATMVAVVNDTRILGWSLELDSMAGRTLTTIIAFLIVFRTNQSYNRWWEGRILWGKMHWCCVELSQQASSWIEDPQLATRIMNFSIAFAYTVKQCLRREQLHAEDLHGIVDPAEVARMNLMAGPIMPYYCTDVIRQCIKKGLTDKPQTFGAQAVARGIDIPVAQLASQFADMARVRNTPQPDVFRVMLHMFTIVYLLLLPILSYDAMGYWIVPEVFFTSYLMLGLQLAARYLEDPFGYDLSDLELDLFVANIADQCRTAFYLGEKNGVDLTLSDGGAGRQQQQQQRQQHSNPDPDCSRITEPMNGTVSTGDTTRATSTSSPDTHGAMSRSSSNGDETRSLPDNNPPSPASRLSVSVAGGGGHNKIPSEEIYVPPSRERGRSTVSQDSTNGYEDRAADRSKSGPVGSGNGSGGGSSRRALSIRHRTQEDVAPRRRSKSRPGRGRAPLGDETSFSPPPPQAAQQYNFEKQDSSVDADVV